MDRSQKAAIIEGMKAKANDASIAVVTVFKGMTVEESTNLRVNLRKAGGEYQVIKNTLGRIAFTDSKHDVAKDSKTFQIKSGSLDGKPMTAEEIDALAKLPGREQLLGQMLATMNAVPTNFVCLFANMLRGLLYALKAIEEKKGAAA